MTILKFSNIDLVNEESLHEVVRKIMELPKKSISVVVEEMGRTREALLEAGEKSAQQELVLASTLAESSRTFHVQVAQQVTLPTSWMQTRKQLSDLFEELSYLLQGVYLMGNITSQGQNILVSCGQRASAIIVVEALRTSGVQAKAFSARELILAAQSSLPNSLQESVVADFHQELSSLMKGNIIPVVPSLLGSIAERL